MDDYTKLQKIYEGFRGQHASLKSYGPNMKWTPGDAPPNQTLSNIPGHLPLASPDSGLRRPASGEGALQGLTTPIDEETPEKEISNLEVLEKINDLIDQANDDGMDYCIHALGQLKDHIFTL